jgi:hypothetical protein
VAGRMLRSNKEVRLKGTAMKRTFISLAAVLVLGAPAAASAATQTASAGGVTATFSFTGRYPNYSHERLQIQRSGNVVYNEPVASEACGTYCAPGAMGSRASSVHVLDLEHNGSPDVVLALYSGGAHCCSIKQVFSYAPSSGGYVKTERNFGDPGDRIRVINGREVFFTADDRFASAFTDYAASGLPLQILSFANGQFHDVTRTFPTQIAADAGMWMKAFNNLAGQRYSDSVGIAAAWAADEELLANGAGVHGFLQRQAHEGHLNSVVNPTADSGERFVRALDDQLRHDGYVHSGTPVEAASIPACSTSELTATLIPGSPGAGQRYATLELMNNSRHSCQTYGHVGLQFLGGYGRRVATDVIWNAVPAPRRVVIPAGGAATAQLHWAAVPGTGDQGGPCLTPPTHVEITPPDETSHLEIVWTGGVVCERGRIDVAALVPAPMCGGYALDQTIGALRSLSRRRTQTSA